MSRSVADDPYVETHQDGRTGAPRYAAVEHAVRLLRGDAAPTTVHELAARVKMSQRISAAASSRRSVTPRAAFAKFAPDAVKEE